MSEYHQIQAISQSFLKAFDNDPAKAVAQYFGDLPRDPPTKSMRIGQAVERLLWGGDVVEIPATALNAQGHRKGAAWTTFATENEGRLLMTAAELEPLYAIRAQVRQHKEAESLLFGEGQTWTVVLWKSHGEQCKAELDRCPAYTSSGVKVICDLKTAIDNTPEGFARQALSLGYHRQAAWYQDAAYELIGEWLPMVFVVIKNEQSYGVECFELDEEFIELGRRQNNASFDRYLKCRDAGEYVSETHGEIVTIEAPRWAAFTNDYQPEELTWRHSKPTNRKHQSS